jgi:hypothetical protein
VNQGSLESGFFCLVSGVREDPYLNNVISLKRAEERNPSTQKDACHCN